MSNRIKIILLCLFPVIHGFGQNYLSVGYEPVKGKFYFTYWKETIRLYNPDSTLNSLIGTLYGSDSSSVQNLNKPQFRATKLLVDSNRQPIYYGNGPFIQQGIHLDSIPAGGIIRSLSLVNNQPAWALLENNDTNYLFYRNRNNWDLNPVMTIEHPFTAYQNGLAMIATALLILLAYLQYECQAMRKKFKVNSEVNELLTKPERPLGLLDEDLLGFDAVEDAITRIIRNPQLELPMTIVISGTWGSGKSSMMNRIRERLQQPALRRRFMTTWFNAWHLQGESSLLNSFLLNIIDCYEKFYQSLSPFRVKIAAARYIRLPFWKKFGFGFAFALLSPFVILLVLQVLPIDHPRSWDWVNSYCTMLSNIFFPAQGMNAKVLTPIGAAILLLFSILFVNKQFTPTGLSAFFELLPRNNFRLDVEQAEIGSREKFRQQYWEIMDAGRQGTRLVVFIDDLDRIGGDKILELLEGINFISDTASRPPTSSSAPNTIFILGMYTQEVARLVGTQLKKINGSDLPEDVLGTLYIEKMVQLIVPVPFDTADKNKLKKLYEN